MPTIAFAGPELISLLQSFAAGNSEADAAADAATKADFDAQLAVAQKAHDDAVAAAAKSLDTAANGIAQAEADKAKADKAARALRDAKILAAISFVQTGQPVTIDLADESATQAA